MAICACGTFTAGPLVVHGAMREGCPDTPKFPSAAGGDGHERIALRVGWVRQWRATRWSSVRAGGGAFGMPRCWRPCGAFRASASWAPRYAARAYDDRPLLIGEGQTISQPYIVAAMTEALQLQAGDRVLEVGTGSGYSAAVLAEIVAEVYTIERIESLAESARRRLVDLGYTNVHVRHGDGSLGWSQHAPYDAIVVTAAGPHVPSSLLHQLAIGGRLVMPVGRADAQYLVRVVRQEAETYAREILQEVVFVPLIGAEAWRDSEGVAPR